MTLPGANAYYLDMVAPRVVELSHFQDGMALHVMHIQHHADSRVHTHDFSELVIVLGGSGVHVAPAGDYPIVAGDAFVLHGRQAHGYRNTADLELVNILFRLDELGIPLQDILSLPGYHALFTLEPLFRQRDKFESRLRLAPDELQHVAELVNRMKRESDGRVAGWRFATVACFMLLMGDLCRYYTRAEYPAAQPLLRLGRVLGHLEQQYRDPITLDELADVGEMSRRTLTREFRRALGCSPIEYLIRLRINRAVTLMQEGDAGVTDIAFEVGFGDSNYFARQFRAIMGCSPRDFRRRAAAAKVGLLGS
ncbi:MAG: helix-turn-helix domain-containing protein [Armatimonadota bacterium]